MGLFGTSTPSPPPPKISKDGAPIAPDRSERARCWEARDAYFKCLDREGIVDSLSEKDKAEKGCASDGRAFEKNCAASWVSLFTIIESCFPFRLKRSCFFVYLGWHNGNPIFFLFAYKIQKLINHFFVECMQVTYFKKRRVMEYQRNKTLEKLKEEGAVQMPGQIGPPGPGQQRP